MATPPIHIHRARLTTSSPGGHHFSRNLQPVDSDGNQVSMWSADGHRKGDDDEEDSEEESSEEEDSDDDAGAAQSAAADASREDRKAQKKARKEAAIAKNQGHTVEVGDLPSSDEESDEDEDMPANPNHSKAARKQAAAPLEPDADAAGEDGVEGITDGVNKLKAPASRRERESMEAAAAKEKYMKLHAAGKTDEAKADMARLKVIREQRAADTARRQVMPPLYFQLFLLLSICTY